MDANLEAVLRPGKLATCQNGIESPSIANSKRLSATSARRYIRYMARQRSSRPRHPDAGRSHDKTCLAALVWLPRLKILGPANSACALTSVP